MAFSFLLTGLGLVVFSYLSFKFMYKRNKCKVIRNSSKCHLAVMSRYPVPGKTKTRLIKELRSEGAALAQIYMTEHLLDTVSTYSNDCHQNVQLSVHYYGGNQQQLYYWLNRRNKDKSHITWYPQHGESLGDRILNTARSCFNQGAEYVVIAGSDIPGINKAILTETFHILENADTSGSQVVLGPAKDGGYYLIGFTKHCEHKLDQIFCDIDWGTDKVCQQQVNKIKGSNLSLHVLSTVLNDVDLPEDLPVFEKEIGINLSQIKHPTWSIVIPTLNEEQCIYKTISSIIQNCSDTSNIEEIIVVDGGSTDKTLEIIKDIVRFSSNISIIILHSSPGRGIQLNSGFKEAKGSFLMTIHADVVLPVNFDVLGATQLTKPGVSLVAFSFGLDVLIQSERYKEKSWFFVLLLKIISKATNWRSSKFELPYGDQALCIKKTTYNTIGGYEKVYLMEDVKLVDKCKSLGHIVTLPQPVIINSRRWKQYGPIKVTMWNLFIITAYRFGVDQQTLSKWYYGDKISTTMQEKLKQ